jgi:hypothetical protein
VSNWLTSIAILNRKPAPIHFDAKINLFHIKGRRNPKGINNMIFSIGYLSLAIIPENVLNNLKSIPSLEPGSLDRYVIETTIKQ